MSMVVACGFSGTSVIDRYGPSNAGGWTEGDRNRPVVVGVPMHFGWGGGGNVLIGGAFRAGRLSFLLTARNDVPHQSHYDRQYDCGNDCARWFARGGVFFLFRCHLSRK